MTSGGQMTGDEHRTIPRHDSGYGHESDVLLRQLDGYLAMLRTSRVPIDLTLAERLTAALRQLVTDTVLASAADRARVRAAVHYVVLRRQGRPNDRWAATDRWAALALLEDIRVVNDILLALGRDDLIIGPTIERAA